MVQVAERHLKAVLDPLVQSLGPEADNLSFLVQMFDKIAEHCDAFDGDTFRTHLLASVRGAHSPLSPPRPRPNGFSPPPAREASPM